MSTNTTSGIEAILLAVHGMGPTKPGFAKRFYLELRERLGTDSSKVHFDSIYYQDVFQKNQDELWKRMSNRRLDWRKLRKLMLFGFSDAAGYERKAGSSGSSYEQVQMKIRDKLKELYEEVGSKPIVVAAQSLGGQVISNYIWDAQQPNGATRGIWKSSPAKSSLDQKGEFLRFRTLRLFCTTGCNIPIFLACLPKEKILAIATKQCDYDFDWINFYDVDDALGWPLKPLSDSYKAAVSLDKQVNVGGLWSSWNPASHTRYWTDRDVIKPLADRIRTVAKSDKT